MRDQAILFCLRLKKLGVDVKMDFMKGYMHGSNS